MENIIKKRVQSSARRAKRRDKQLAYKKAHAAPPKPKGTKDLVPPLNLPSPRISELFTEDGIECFKFLGCGAFCDMSLVRYQFQLFRRKFDFFGSMPDKEKMETAKRVLERIKSFYVQIGRKID